MLFLQSPRTSISAKSCYFNRLSSLLTYGKSGSDQARALAAENTEPPQICKAYCSRQEKVRRQSIRCRGMNSRTVGRWEPRNARGSVVRPLQRRFRPKRRRCSRANAAMARTACGAHTRPGRSLRFFRALPQRSVPSASQDGPFPKPVWRYAGDGPGALLIVDFWRPGQIDAIWTETQERARQRETTYGPAPR